MPALEENNTKLIYTVSFVVFLLIKFYKYYLKLTSRCREVSFFSLNYKIIVQMFCSLKTLPNLCSANTNKG